MITVTLTEYEIAERARSLAQYANKLAELSDEEEGAKARHKQLMADIKERRLDISNELRRLSRAVRLGVEERTTQRVLFDEEQRLEEFRREQKVKERAEELIAEGEELIEQQQQAEANEAAVAEFFEENGEAQAEPTDEAEPNQADGVYVCQGCDVYVETDLSATDGLCSRCWTPDAIKDPEERAAFIAENSDDLTASRCDECKMIEGGHQPSCSKSNALTHDDYLAYAQAHYKKNHQSHARKMSLTRLNDEQVREWKQQQASSTVEAEPEPKKKGRKKLSPVEAAIDR